MGTLLELIDDCLLHGWKSILERRCFIQIVARARVFLEKKGQVTLPGDTDATPGVERPLDQTKRNVNLRWVFGRFDRLHCFGLVLYTLSGIVLFFHFVE